MNYTIYVRTLKKAEHTVFAVEDGQKRYYDPQFKQYIPYSSGQQVKRSLLDTLTSVLNREPAPTTFYWQVNNNNELKEGEVHGNCNPAYPDQLLGGWMKAAKGGNEKTLKRRSPLSVSAMRALHPLLANTYTENISFDRSDRSNNKVVVRDPQGNELLPEEISDLLKGKDRSLRRKWIPNNRRATGLFVQDIAIDLRRLFCVLLNPFEPEISEDTEKELRNNGWIEAENVFGKCLVMQENEREKIIPALAESIVEWSITSNQARTFSLMETLAVAVSDNANKVASAIRAELSEDIENQAYPKIEEDLEGVEMFITPAASGHIANRSQDPEALEKLKQNLIENINAFNFENQMKEA